MTENTEGEIFRERLEYLGSNSKNKGGKSDKFYEIVITGDGGRYTETRTWGKFTAVKPGTKVIEHYSEWDAKDSAERMLRKKRKKGYHKVVNALTRLASVMDDE